MRTDVRTEGFRELEEALAQLPRALGRSALREAADQALQPMANAAAQAAPVRSGRLAFSIVVSERRTRRAKRARDIGGGRAIGGQQFTMAMGVGSGVGALYYGYFVEFGTVDTPAQPFMRPAWDAHKDGALDRIKTNLGAAIERAAQRAERQSIAATRWFERHRR